MSKSVMIERPEQAWLDEVSKLKIPLTDYRDTKVVDWEKAKRKDLLTTLEKLNISAVVIILPPYTEEVFKLFCKAPDIGSYILYVDEYGDFCGTSKRIRFEEEEE